MSIREFEIYSNKNILRGKHYIANSHTKQNKTILMCHGFAGVQDILLPKYAANFTLEGFDVVTFDYNGFGKSQGEKEIIPTNQIADISNIILYIQQHEAFLNNKLYLWGTSLGGLYVLKLASSIQGISGVYTVGLDLEERARYLKQIDSIKYKEITENKKLLFPIKKLLSDSQSKSFLEKYTSAFPELGNTRLSFTTIRDINNLSIDLDLNRINIPVLLLKAKNDIVNSPSEMDYIYCMLVCNKKLVEFDCGHYDVYEDFFFKEAISQQIQWFKEQA